MACAQIAGGFFSDFIIKRRYLSRTWTRKMFSGVGLTGCAICLALIPTSGCDQIFAMALLITGMFSYGLVTGGDMVMPAEMTQKVSVRMFALRLET